MKVSIIIPCISINEQTIMCIRRCLELEHDDFEVIVLPDATIKKSKDERLRIIPTGKIKPSLKRNMGIKEASGELLAFIDDDAYPSRNWLKNAANYFVHEKIGIVGGPNLLPHQADFVERVSDRVLKNFFVLGPASIRYRPAKNRFVAELPSCNYISRNLGIVYDETLITAEDSKYCFDVALAGYKVLYARDVVVWHHRRSSFFKHIKQLYIYGRDIALLSKREPSYGKVYYALPSIGFLVFFTGVLVSFFSDLARYWFLVVLSIYALIILLSSLDRDFSLIIPSWLLGMGSHFAYGVGWLVGVFGTRENARVRWNSR